MYTISTKTSANNIIKYRRYKLNEQQYFEIETDMETKYRRVLETWMWDSPPPEGDGVFNIGVLVRCHNSLWEIRTRGTAAADSWAVIWPAGNNEPKNPAVFAAFLSLVFGSSVGHWHWWRSTPRSLLSREFYMPRLLMETSEFDGDGKREKDYWKLLFTEGVETDIWEIIRRKTNSV